MAENEFKGRHFATADQPKPSAGGAGRNCPRGLAVAFTAVCLAIMIAPLAGMVVAPTTETSEKKELASWPSVLVDGSPNIQFLGQAGRYFEDHFAFRSQLVDLDALLKGRLLKTSATDRVIVGDDGWLFYQGTLDDYQRTGSMTDRAIFNAAHNLSLVQEYVTLQGARLVVTVAPNKNTLYPEYMPYYILAGEGPSNLDRFSCMAGAMGLDFLDLREALGADGTTLYYQTDSHWTNEGALVGAEALLSALEWPHEQLDGTDVTTTAHLGDVATMLLPLSAEPEDDVEYAAAQEFTWVEGSTVEDSTVITMSTRPGATGSLLAFRDSFGNALLPYLASEFANAQFSKLIPYDMGLVAQRGADVVIIERAERHLASFATTPPYMYGLRRSPLEFSTALAVETDTTLSARTNGPYLQVGGSVEAGLVSPEATVYVGISSPGVEEAVYEAFLVSSQAEAVSDVDGAGEPGADEVVGDNGYRVFLPLQSYAGVIDGAQVRVYLKTAETGCLCVYEGAIADVMTDASA